MNHDFSDTLARPYSAGPSGAQNTSAAQGASNSNNATFSAPLPSPRPFPAAGLLPSPASFGGPASSQPSSLPAHVSQSQAFASRTMPTGSMYAGHNAYQQGSSGLSWPVQPPSMREQTYSYPPQVLPSNEYFPPRGGMLPPSDRRPASSLGLPAAGATTSIAQPTPYALGPMNPATSLLGGNRPADEPTERWGGMPVPRSYSESPPAAAQPVNHLLSRSTSSKPLLQETSVAELKRVRNKESSQRFRDRTKERQKEKDQRLEYLERRVYELESYSVENHVLREENMQLKGRVNELETQLAIIRNPELSQGLQPGNGGNKRTYYPPAAT